MDKASELIGALNEGIVEDRQWLAALDRLADAFGSAGLFLGSTSRSGTGFELSGHRVDPQWIDLVNGALAGHESNIVYSAVSSALRSDPAGTLMRPMVISRMVDTAAYRSSPIYTQAIAPAGHEHAMVIILSAEASSAVSLTLIRPASGGDFGAADAALAESLGPHLLAALKLRHQFAVARSGAMMLDLFDHGVLLLSSTGHVVHANAQAERLLGERDGLALEHGELRAAFPRDTKRLRQLIGEADRAARIASLRPREAVRLERRSGRADLVVRALPVAPVVASTFGVGEVATIALFLHDPGAVEQAIEPLLRDAFRLTVAESAVAARIWEGDSVAEAAASLGLSANTVKSHLKVVFEKAEVDRQPALVRRIGRLLAAVGSQ